jgi:hypothetical protein
MMTFYKVSINFTYIMKLEATYIMYDDFIFIITI